MSYWSRWPRLRGIVLRLALDRKAAGAAGGALVMPAGVLWWGDYPWETWWTDGLGLVLGATGMALVVMALGGRQPDWIDPEGAGEPRASHEG